MRAGSELPNIARVGSLIGNPVRALIIGALMDGSERPASELAALSGATPQATSAHLSGLVDGGMLTVRHSGRHRFYRLRSQEIASAIEVLSFTATMTSTRPSTERADLKHARRCYDHLAGRLGVAICDTLVARQHIVAGGDGGFLLSDSGTRWLASIDLEPPAAPRRALVRPCFDWTERRSHLAGWLGAALCDRLEQRDAVRRRAGTRAVSVTPGGRQLLATLFELQWTN